MNWNRRKFVSAAASAAAATVGLVETGGAGIYGGWVGGSGRASLAALHFEAFLPCVGTEFWVNGPGQRRVALSLGEVLEGGSRHGGESFSLHFWGMPEQRLEQGTYGFEHVRLGRIAMFMVPSGGVTRGRQGYWVEFSRLPAGMAERPLGSLGSGKHVT